MTVQQRIKFTEKVIKLYEKMGWCRNYYALTKNNKSVEPTSKKAYRFCLSGAYERVRGGIYCDLFLIGREMGDLGLLGNHNSIISYNDNTVRDKRSVVRMLKKYVKILKGYVNG